MGGNRQAGPQLAAVLLPRRGHQAAAVGELRQAHRRLCAAIPTEGLGERERSQSRELWLPLQTLPSMPAALNVADLRRSLGGNDVAVAGPTLDQRLHDTIAHLIRRFDRRQALLR